MRILFWLAAAMEALWIVSFAGVWGGAWGCWGAAALRRSIQGGRGPPVPTGRGRKGRGGRASRGEPPLAHASPAGPSSRIGLPMARAPGCARMGARVLLDDLA